MFLRSYGLLCCTPFDLDLSLAAPLEPSATLLACDVARRVTRRGPWLRVARSLIMSMTPEERKFPDMLVAGTTAEFRRVRPRIYC